MFFINVMSYPFQKWIRYKNKEQNASFYSMSPLVSLRTLAWQPFPVLLFLQLAILAFSEIKDIVLTGQCQDSHVYMTRSLATEGMSVVSGGGDDHSWKQLCTRPVVSPSVLLAPLPSFQFLVCNMGEPEVKLCFFLEKSGGSIYDHVTTNLTAVT